MKILKQTHLINRLDIFIKIFYIDAYLGNADFNVAKTLYQKHILLFNAGSEDNKKSIKDFENAFQSLIDSIQKNGFHKDSPIPINKRNELINGAHRFACCIYFNIEPHFSIEDGEGSIWDDDWFNKNNFSSEEKLNIYHYFCRFNTNYCIYIVWPTLVSHTKEISKDVSKVAQKVGTISLTYDRKILSELIKDIYSYDPGNVMGGLGIDKKIVALSESKEKQIDLIIFKKKTDFNERDFKDTLREKYKKFSPIQDGTERFYTFHSGEDFLENNYIAELFFHPGNFESYKYRKSIEDTNPLIKRISKFRKYLVDQNKSLNNLCIVGSSILEICGIRPSSDLDLISTENNNGKSEKISDEIEIFHYNYSNIISNDKLISQEKNYLFFRGIKYLNPEVYLNIKKQFLRKKDVSDIRLLEKFLQNRSEGKKIGISKKIIFEFLYLKKKYITYTIMFGIALTKKLGIYKQSSYLWRKYILRNLKSGK